MTLRERLRPFFHVTVAALMNIVIYIALYGIWGAILSEVKALFVRNLILSVMVCVGYAFCLFFLTYLRRGAGDDKVCEDYRDTPYTTWQADLRIFLGREQAHILIAAGIILLRAVLVEVDHLLFGELFFAHVLAPYVAMNFMGSVLPVPILADLCSAALITVFYALFALIRRRRAYRYWMENGGGK